MWLRSVKSNCSANRQTFVENVTRLPPRCFQIKKKPAPLKSDFIPLDSATQAPGALAYVPDGQALQLSEPADPYMLIAPISW